MAARRLSSRRFEAAGFAGKVRSWTSNGPIRAINSVEALQLIGWKELRHMSEMSGDFDRQITRSPVRRIASRDPQLVPRRPESGVMRFRPKFARKAFQAVVLSTWTDHIRNWSIWFARATQPYVDSGASIVACRGETIVRDRRRQRRIVEHQIRRFRRCRSAGAAAQRADRGNRGDATREALRGRRRDAAQGRFAPGGLRSRRRDAGDDASCSALARGEEHRGGGGIVLFMGAENLPRPVRVTSAILERLDAFIPLAPLHQPHNLAVIRAILADRPDLPQVACFDTAFHSSQPPIAQAFAIPRKYSEAGVRRYGFHGISYQFIAGRLKVVAPTIANGRVIVAHLGNGASLCALKDGKSIACTLGFTTVDGLVMGTRCGSLDPGVLIHLMDHYGLGARDLEDLLNRKSGLLGVSGISSDMRTLRASAEPTAREAIALFIYRLVREIGSLAAALGGVDAIVFTGGIGENDAETRADAAAGCAWLGVILDDAANRAAEIKISTSNSPVAVYVIPTNEEYEIAQSARRIDCELSSDVKLLRRAAPATMTDRRRASCLHSAGRRGGSLFRPP